MHPMNGGGMHLRYVSLQNARVMLHDSQGRGCNLQGRGMLIRLADPTCVCW